MFHLVLRYLEMKVGIRNKIELMNQSNQVIGKKKRKKEERKRNGEVEKEKEKKK